MAVFELVSGDFEQGVLRLRYSEAGRAFLRLLSNDGVVEDMFLERDVAAVAESGEGQAGEHLARWIASDVASVHPAPPTGRRGDGRGERPFVVLLRDGRKFVARGTPEVVAEIKAAALPADRRAKLSRLDAARAAAEARGHGFLPRLLPGFVSRILTER